MPIKVRIALATAIAVFCAASLPVHAGKRTAPAGDANGALAIVNAEPVTPQQLLDLFTDRHSGHAKFLGGYNEARQFLNIVIDDRLLVQEAYDLGLDQDPAVKQLVDDFVTEKATKRLISQEVDAKTRPSAEDIRRAWEGIGFYVQGFQIAVNTREEAEEIRRLLVRGEDAEVLARACSIAPSRLRGGMFVAGWGQFPPEWEQVVFSLQPGDVSPVIETRDAFEVVVVLDRDTVEKPPLAEVSSSIEAVLYQRNLESRQAEFSSYLWKTYHVVLPDLDFTPRGVLDMLRTAPDTVVARWDGDGKLTAKQVFSESALPEWLAMSPPRGRYEVATHLRATVNAPLVELEARARKVGEIPEIAEPADKYRDYTMESVLFRDHIFRDVAVSDEEARAYYDAHKEEFEDPEQRRVAHILLSTEADAVEVRRKLAEGADFDQLVKQRSRDYMTASSGGDLGWITADRVPSQFAEVLKMDVGAVSNPIKSAQGWHLVKVLEVKAKQQIAFENAAGKAREKALAGKKGEARKAWIEKLRAASTIEVNDAAIRKFVADNQMGDVNAAPSIQHSVPAGSTDH